MPSVLIIEGSLRRPWSCIAHLLQYDNDDYTGSHPDIHKKKGIRRKKKPPKEQASENAT